MSLAEDLLDSLPDNAAATHSADPETELHIVVNSDRTVTVPESLKHIAVQHDHNIETVTFDCPRYWDGHDLSQMKLRIVFQRPDGHREPHLAENVRVDPDDVNVIHFDWTISNNVTPVKGAISFIACAKIADADGIIEREWHTILNQDLIVDEGMDCSGEEIVEQNPDIIEYILAQLDELKDSGSGSPAAPTPDSSQNPAQGGLSPAAASMLITILRNLVPYSPQTANIDALEALLSQTEKPVEGVYQTGSVLTIIDPDSCVQDGSKLIIT